MDLGANWSDDCGLWPFRKAKTFMRTLLLALAISFLAAVALRPAAVSQDEALRELVVLEEAEPQTPYPLLAQSMSEQRLAELLFDRLFEASRTGAPTSPVFEGDWQTTQNQLRLEKEEKNGLRSLRHRDEHQRLEVLHV